MAPHKDKKGKELFIAVLQESDKRPDRKDNSSFDRWKKKSTVESVKETGDTATVTVRNPDGGIETVNLVKQDGKWRIKIPLFGSK